MTRFIQSSLAVLFLFLSLSQLAAQPLVEIGLIDLRNRLGGSAPTGVGITVMQGEFDGGVNAYLPNPSNPQFAGKTFIDRSVSGSVSGHATTVGINFFGLTDGVAPGITTVHNYGVSGSLSAGDWIGPAYLNFGGPAPLVETTLRVQNHSWIGTGFDADALEMHRRYDFALRRDSVIGVVGVNNGAGTVPALLGNTYNSIAVGLTNGNSSVGPSTGDVVGRSKPDIVGPETATSWSTPLVAGAAALLLQTADQSGNPNAGRIETIKSALLSGATKDEFAGLATPWNRINNGSFVESLDRRFGAGELNINNSHLILSQTEKIGTDQVLDGSTGWDFETVVGAGSTRLYFFDLGHVANIRFTATANWLRRITPTGGGANVFATSDATLSNVELRLFLANPDFSLGALLDSSLSPIDNVQHIFNTNLLGNQRYALEVTLAGLPGGQPSEDIGVAWITSFTAIPEPSSIILGVCVAAGVAVYFRRRVSLRDTQLETPFQTMA